MRVEGPVMRCADSRFQAPDLGLWTLDFDLRRLAHLTPRSSAPRPAPVQRSLPPAGSASSPRGRWRRICSRRRSRPGWRRTALPVAGLAVEGGIGGNEDAFDQRTVSQPPEKLLRGIARSLFSHQFDSRQRVMLLQHFAQGPRQIRHLFPTFRAVRVEPFQQLLDAVGRLAPGLELRFQFLGQCGI